MTELPVKIDLQRIEDTYRSEYERIKKHRNKEYLESLKKILLAKENVDKLVAKTSITKQLYLNEQEKARHQIEIESKYKNANVFFLTNPAWEETHLMAQKEQFKFELLKIGVK